MRKYRLISTIAFMLLIPLWSCDFFGKDDEPLDPNKLTCFLAISEKDTAWLSIDTTTKRIRVKGNFKISYAKGTVYNGQFEGAFKGDTLKGHYDFKQNKGDKWYRNPVAFLAKNGKLIMGVGDFAMIWGSPFFDEKKAIDYEKGRFVFEKIACN